MSNNNAKKNKSDNNLLLSVQDLAVQFFTDEGLARAVDGIGFDIPSGRTVALVGESGCGKTVTALSILRLVPQPPGKIVAGRIIFQGRDLFELNEKQMRKIRGKNIAMIFQEPMTSLNPVYTIGDQIVEAVEQHQITRQYMDAADRRTIFQPVRTLRPCRRTLPPRDGLTGPPHLSHE